METGPRVTVKKNAQEECMQAGSGWGAVLRRSYDAKWVKKAITRLVLVETLGGIAPPTRQFLHVFAKEAAGSKTDRTEYGAASASASSFVVPQPHHTQVAADLHGGGGGRRRKHQQAGAQDAHNWIKNKQAANGLLSSAPVEGARAA